MASAKRILVCGSSYGRAYFQALRGSSRYVAAGLLAAGSSRSRNLAVKYRIPLYLRVDEIPLGYDLACFALPSASSEIALDLLRREIPVLCEHPRNGAFVQAAIAEAHRSLVPFHVNAHFGDLSAGRAFARESRRLMREAAPVRVEIAATERSLYAALDLLGRASVLPQTQFSATRDHDWISLRAFCGGIPADFKIHAPGSRPLDGSPSYLVDIRVSVYFESGVLSMLSVAGPVVWNSNLSVAADRGAILWRFVTGGGRAATPHLLEERSRANLLAIAALDRETRGAGGLPWQQPDHLLAVSRAWDAALSAMNGLTE